MSDRATAVDQTRHLQPKALYEAIADRVRERILSHDLKPSQPIDEMEFVNGYGVSRTPVREALKVLHHEGLLTLMNRRGMVVTELGQYERQEALQLYRLLCTYATSEGADLSESMRPRLLRRLLQLVECQLRLAYGPSFEGEMQRLGLPRPDSLASASPGTKAEQKAPAKGAARA